MFDSTEETNSDSAADAEGDSVSLCSTNREHPYSDSEDGGKSTISKSAQTSKTHCPDAASSSREQTKAERKSPSQQQEIAVHLPAEGLSSGTSSPSGTGKEVLCGHVARIWQCSVLSGSSSSD